MDTMTDIPTETHDQAPAPSEESPQQDPSQGNPLEILKPKAAVKAWVIGPPDGRMELIQRPLSLFKKMEWFALVGDVVDRAMSGPNPLQLGNLFASPGLDGGVLKPEDFNDADTFVQAVGKLIMYMPDFLQKSFCIWLNVPDYRTELAMEYMALPPEEGGLSDDDGFEIIEIFIDQNYKAIQDLFGDRLGKLRRRVEDRQKERAR